MDRNSLHIIPLLSDRESQKIALRLSDRETLRNFFITRYYQGTRNKYSMVDKFVIANCCHSVYEHRLNITPATCREL